MNNIYYKKYIKYKTKYVNLQYGGTLQTEEIVSAPIIKYTCNKNILDKELCISDEKGSKGTFKNLTFEDSSKDTYNTYDTRDICNIECNHLWKNNYKKLYENILKFIESDITDQNKITDLKTQFIVLIEEINKIYSDSNFTTSEKLIIKYNIRFIISIMSILFDISELNVIIDGHNYNNTRVFNGKGFYYIEECYTDDLDLFYKEYENLYRTKKSRFFYQSNLVNISILLKCYNEECILKGKKLDELTDVEYKYYKKLNDVYDLKKNTILKVFQTYKIELLQLLLAAYEDFNYNKIKLFYLKYLDFYYNAFTISPHLPFLLLKDDDQDENNYKIQYNKLLDILTNSQPEPNNCVVYLSAILSSENKFIKFNTTRILIGYLGMRYNNDYFYDSIDNITHDFTTAHDQYKCKSKVSDDELKETQTLLKKLYIFYKDPKETLIFLKETLLFIDDKKFPITIKSDLNSILKFLHVQLYENSPYCLTINNIVDLYKKFSLTSRHIYNILIDLITNYINKISTDLPYYKRLEDYKKRLKESYSIKNPDPNLSLFNILHEIIHDDNLLFKDLFIDSADSVDSVDSVDSENLYTHEIYMLIKDILYPRILEITKIKPILSKNVIILSICDYEYTPIIIKHIKKCMHHHEYIEVKNNYSDLLYFLLSNGYKSHINNYGHLNGKSIPIRDSSKEISDSHFLNNIIKFFLFTS
jgi:hypothetical protein